MTNRRQVAESTQFSVLHRLCGSSKFLLTIFSALNGTNEISFHGRGKMMLTFFFLKHECTLWQE